MKPRRGKISKRVEVGPGSVTKVPHDAAIAHAWRDGVYEGARMLVQATTFANKENTSLLISLWLKELQAWTENGGELPRPRLRMRGGIVREGVTG